MGLLEHVKINTYPHQDTRGKDDEVEYEMGYRFLSQCGKWDHAHRINNPGPQYVAEKREVLTKPSRQEHNRAPTDAKIQSEMEPSDAAWSKNSDKGDA